MIEVTVVVGLEPSHVEFARREKAIRELLADITTASLELEMCSIRNDQKSPENELIVSSRMAQAVIGGWRVVTVSASPSFAHIFMLSDWRQRNWIAPRAITAHFDLVRGWNDPPAGALLDAWYDGGIASDALRFRRVRRC